MIFACFHWLTAMFLAKKKQQRRIVFWNFMENLAITKDGLATNFPS